MWLQRKVETALLAGLLVLVASSVQAQGSAAAAVAVPPPVSTPLSPDDTSTAPVASLPAALDALTPADPNTPAGAPLIDERAGVDATLVRLATMQRRLRELRGELEIATTQAELNEVRGGTDLTGGLTDTPELVGIYGTDRALTAEFVVGRAILVAKAGDWVTPEWRLRRVLANGVELEQRGSSKPKTLLFGNRTPSAQGAARPIAPAQPLSAPMVPPASAQ